MGQQQQQMVQQQQLSEEGEQLRGVWVVWHQLSAQRVKRVQSLQQYWQATALTISVRQWYQWAAERTDNRILSAQAQHMREVLQLRGAWSRWQQQPPSKLTWSQVAAVACRTTGTRLTMTATRRKRGPRKSVRRQRQHEARQAAHCTGLRSVSDNSSVSDCSSLPNCSSMSDSSSVSDNSSTDESIPQHSQLRKIWHRTARDQHQMRNRLSDREKQLRAEVRGSQLPAERAVKKLRDALYSVDRALAAGRSLMGTAQYQIMRAMRDASPQQQTVIVWREQGKQKVPVTEHLQQQATQWHIAGWQARFLTALRLRQAQRRLKIATGAALATEGGVVGVEMMPRKWVAFFFSCWRSSAFTRLASRVQEAGSWDTSEVEESVRRHFIDLWQRRAHASEHKMMSRIWAQVEARSSRGIKQVLIHLRN
jgi:hypothetical protein